MNKFDFRAMMYPLASNWSLMQFINCIASQTTLQSHSQKIWENQAGAHNKAPNRD